MRTALCSHTPSSTAIAAYPCFFVISGFLITSLLLKEEQVTGKISIRDFYIRRVFRILPPFWVFLAVVALLWELGTIETSWASLGIAFAFLRDFVRGDWWTGHSWSLSIEEQFYLLWPAALVLLGRRKSLWTALGLIVAAPVIRVLSHVLITGKLGPIENFMFHMRVDSLMLGCALAMVYKTQSFARIAERILKWPGMLAALGFFLFVSGYLNYRFQGYYMLPFGYTLESIAISYLLMYFVTKTASVGTRLLNELPGGGIVRIVIVQLAHPIFKSLPQKTVHGAYQQLRSTKCGKVYFADCHAQVAGVEPIFTRGPHKRQDWLGPSMTELEKYFADYHSTAERNDSVWTNFEKNTGSIHFLKSHRDWVEQNSWGFGDPHFTTCGT